MRPLSLLLATLLLAGCLSPGDSAESRLWDFPASERAATARIKVQLPAALRRPTVVTVDHGQTRLHDLDRWSAPLAESLAQAIGARLANQPIHEAVIDIQRLDVSADGDAQLLFTARVTLLSSQGDRGPEITVASKLQHLANAHTETAAKPSLDTAMAAYRNRVPAEIAVRIAAEIANDQGGVAKPPAAVTVPGK